MLNRLRKKRQYIVKFIQANGKFSKYTIRLNLTYYLVFSFLFATLLSSIYKISLLDILLPEIPSLLLNIIIMILLIQKVKNIENYHEDDLVALSIDHIDRDLKPFIKSLMIDMANNINVNIENMSIYTIPKDGSINLRIRGNRDSSILYISEGFFKLISNHKTLDIGKSLLNHEIAHCEQEDNYIWMYYSIYQNILIKLVIPLNIAVSVFLFGFFIENHPDFAFFCIIAALFPIMQILQSSMWLFFFYRLSEKMADLAVVLYSNGEHLYQALDKYYPEEDGLSIFKSHPSVKARKKYISKTIKILNRNRITPQ